jgi:hypothetical protein
VTAETTHPIITTVVMGPRFREDDTGGVATYRSNHVQIDSFNRQNRRAGFPRSYRASICAGPKMLVGCTAIIRITNGALRERA